MQRIGSTIAFIPVRGGSKSIPLKNIKPINGRPLVYWVLDAVVKCEEIDIVVVSTDNECIREKILDYNSKKILTIERTQEVSTDTASTESVMLEFASKYDFNDIILVQATSPLLTEEHIKQGLRKYQQKSIDSVLSVVRQKRFIWKEEGEISKPVNYEPACRPRRQDFSGFLVENGAFYITSKENLLATGCRISGNVGTVFMPDESYFELDELSDWVVVEQLLKQNKCSENELSYKLSKIKCLLTDCDGVLTDGGMYYSEDGNELKKFNTKDGMGFSLLREKGFITGIITGEDIQLVRKRADKLGLHIVFLGASDKMQKIDEICERYNLCYCQIAYIGDDINDLEVIKNVGFGCAVNDGMQCVKNAADYITAASGGNGAVREVVELLLQRGEQL